MAKKTSELLHIKLRSPYQNYYSGTASSISANNRLGPFDLLPNHAPLFTLLMPGRVSVRTGDQTLEFRIQNGVLKVKNNQVDVFLNI